MVKTSDKSVSKIQLNIRSICCFAAILSPLLCLFMSILPLFLMYVHHSVLYFNILNNSTTKFQPLGRTFKTREKRANSPVVPQDYMQLATSTSNAAILDILQCIIQLIKVGNHYLEPTNQLANDHNLRNKSLTLNQCYRGSFVGIAYSAIIRMHMFQFL